MKRFQLTYQICAVALLLAPAMMANSTGADPGNSGAPGEGTCYGCHTGGSAENTGPGRVTISASAATWKAGDKLRLTITITDPNARRWGFELAARLSGNRQAGTFTAVDSDSRVMAGFGPFAAFSYVTHSATGTKRGSAGPVTFNVDWTAPAAGSGEVTFYVAANAANNNNNNGDGDFVYTANLKLAESGNAAPVPTVRTTQPALQSWGGRADFASNSYLEIYGTNFCPACPAGGRIWQGGDFTGVNAPTALEGTSVTVNGRPAFIYFVSDAQININTPEDAATGPVAIVVKNANGSSTPVNVAKARVSPALLTASSFNIGGKQYLIAQVANTTTLVGKPGLIAGVNFQAVKPGDSITLYALGLGPTAPATQAGIINAANGDVTLPIQVRIGGQAAQVTFKAAPAGTIGYYQLNVVVPNIGAGDQSIELVVDGVANAQNLFLSNP